MLSELWNSFLYEPVFNLLIWIYNNWTAENLGWAVIYLTILLRVVLLPFTIVTSRDRIRNAAVLEEIQRLNKGYKGDEVVKKEEIRKALKKRKVRPWAKAIVLGFQGLALLLLYQVFIQGITGERVFATLYASINYPGPINTDFFGFNIGLPNDVLWSALVALLLFSEIYWDYRKRKLKLTKKADLIYFIVFPVGVFVVLWMLPMVKALFVLTSMVFSLLVHQIIKLFVRPLKGEAT